jgi:hypothetical protein
MFTRSLILAAAAGASLAAAPALAAPARPNIIVIIADDLALATPAPTARRR